jgi:hypothetical protein
MAKVSSRFAPETRWMAAPCGAITSLLLGLLVLVGGCHTMPPLDTKPLDTAGMSYDSIQQLKALQVTAPEITQLAEARESGFSDPSCVEVVKVYRDRKEPFDAGDSISGLMRSGFEESVVIDLAKMNQLGIGAGELEAMKLANLSDAIILEVARRRADGKPVLSGASLAELKNAGMRQSTLLELARRGVPDSQAHAIISYRRRGVGDTEILNHFARS